jgi:twinkle protein
MPDAEQPLKGSAKNAAFVQGEAMALPARGLTKETCEKWEYVVGTYAGKPTQAANYIKDGKVLGQKLRFADKGFVALGKPKTFFGQHLWRNGGKMLVVTEGEIDAMSVSQLQAHKWPVVSIPNGAGGAAKTFKDELEWLESFEKVVIMYDMDEPGREAAEKCAEVLSPGRAYIAKLPLKDANEMLVAGRGKEVIDAIWGAKEWRPDGIVNAADLWDEVLHSEPKADMMYPWESLNDITHGIRCGELVVITAGTGIGKSAITAEVAYAVLKAGHKVGYVALEENLRRTAQRFVSLELNRPIHLTREGVTEEQMRAAFDATMGRGKLMLYDHFGSMDPETLLGKLRYLVKGLGCRFVVLDHLSIVVSGWDTDDERRAIDITMTKLRSLVEETQCAMIVVSHLKRPGGDAKGHEQGAEVSLAHLRGSHSIGQLSDIIIAAERDQQDPEKKHVTQLRIIKNRYSGETGLAGLLRYDRDTGRLTPSEEVGVVYEAEPGGPASF